MVIFIPIIIGGCAWFVLMNNFSTEVEKIHQAVLRQVQITVDEQLSGVERMSQQISINPYVQQLLQANSGAFLGTAYLVSAIVIAILFFVKKGNQQTTHFVQSLPKTVAYSLLSGFGSFAGNGLLMYLSTKINGGVLYPVINGGLCLVCSAVSFLVFREKPTRQKAAAILTGLAAIVLLCL